MFLASFTKIAISIKKIESMIDNGVSKRVNATAMKRWNEGAKAVKNSYGQRGSEMLHKARAGFSQGGMAMAKASRNGDASFKFKDLSKEDRGLYRQLVRGRQILHPHVDKLPITTKDVRAGVKKPVKKLESKAPRKARSSYQLNLFKHKKKES